MKEVDDMPVKRTTSPARVAAFLALLLGAGTMVLPFRWMLSTSLKESNMVYTIPPQWIPDPVNWDNSVKLWSASNLLTGLKNSAIVSACVLVFFTLSSTMAAFAFSKLRFRLKNLMFIALLTMMMLPLVVLIVPRFILFNKIGWIDSLLPLIIPAPVCYMNIVFFMRQYMMGLPQELMEAAKLDGCGYFGTYWRIFMPLCKPAIIANVIMLFMAVWNDYLNPLVYTHSESMQTVQVSIAMLQSHYIQQTDVPLMMTASLIAILPVLILFIICQKHFAESFAMSGIKA
jgi:multiple sugar transport system permease protein